MNIFGRTSRSVQLTCPPKPWRRWKQTLPSASPPSVAKRSLKPHATIRPTAGLTLIEVILAIAVAGFVLAAAATYVVSISNIWADREERNFFQDHVDGVTEFLKASFASAGTEIALDSEEDPNRNEPGDDPPAAEPDPEEGNSRRNNEKTSADDRSQTAGGLLRVSDEPIGWARPPGASDFEDPLLNFKLATNPPLLVSRGALPALGVDCFLRFDRDEGLSLLWYSVLQEEVEDERDLQRTLLSNLVTELHYIYWDERFEQWEEETEPKEGDGQDQFLLPRYLKLVFEYEGVTTERFLTIPIPSKSALIF